MRQPESEFRAGWVVVKRPYCVPKPWPGPGTPKRPRFPSPNSPDARTRAQDGAPQHPAPGLLEPTAAFLIISAGAAHFGNLFFRGDRALALPPPPGGEQTSCRRTDSVASTCPTSTAHGQPAQADARSAAVFPAGRSPWSCWVFGRPRHRLRVGTLGPAPALHRDCSGSRTMATAVRPA